MRRYTHLTRTLIGAVLFLAACNQDATTPSRPTAEVPPVVQPATSRDNAVVRWDDALCAAFRVALPGPTIVARSLAVMHTAIYEAWAAYDERALGTQLGGKLRRPAAERTDANKDRAISYAAYRAATNLFPAQRPMFDARMREAGYDPSEASMDPTTAEGVGILAADAVLAMRNKDGSNQLGDLHAGAYSDYTGYVPVNTPDTIIDPNHWQPLRIPNAAGGFTVQQFTTPHWNRVTPFALTSASQFRPSRLPNLYPGSVQPVPGEELGFEKEVQQLIDYSAALDDRTKVIAEYWADGPQSELPPGHWCLFGEYVSRRDHHTVDDDAKMFFALANGMLDASIAVWDAKRVFDSARPVSAVHYLMKGKMIRAWGGPGKGTILIRGEDWTPYQPANVVTPPFPEFLSGHSAFSGAGAEILRRYTGSDAFGASWTQPKGTSRVEPGIVPAADVTLSWATFTAAADEAGLSRRYGGIHFEEGDNQSREIGRQVGIQAFAKAQRYWNGTI